MEEELAGKKKCSGRESKRQVHRNDRQEQETSASTPKSDPRQLNLREMMFFEQGIDNLIENTRLPPCRQAYALRVKHHDTGKA